MACSIKKSQEMANVKSKNTKPETTIRSLLHQLGYRFRLHETKLPGTPDIVLPRHKKVIFVNGCFWHQHQGCKKSRRPKTNKKFWDEKLDKNIARDEENLTKLSALGWKTMIIWECETREENKIKKKLIEFMEKQ